MTRLSLLFAGYLLTFGAIADDVSVKVLALFSDKALLQVGDRQKVVSTGETFAGVLLQEAHGRGAVVVIDGETLELKLNQKIAGNFKKRDPGMIRVVPDALGMYYVQGSINDKPTSFIVDTGATFVTLSGRKASALGIDYLQGVPGSAQTASDVVAVWRVTLDSVSIGGIELNNIAATVIPGNQPSEVLLGNSFLRRTEIQQTGSVLQIRKRY